MKQPEVKIPTNVKDSGLVRKRRRQIVRAAMKLFAQKGFHKTSIRDIAGQSGISLGAIYNYVSNKEEILVLNQELFLEAAGAKLKDAIRNVKDPLEKLQRLIRTELHMMDQYADYLLLVSNVRHTLSENYGNLILEIEGRRIRIFDEVLQECIDAGIIVPCNVALTTQFIKVLIDSWVSKNRHIGSSTDIVEMEAAILNLFWSGLLKNGQQRFGQPGDSLQLEGKSVCMVNGETPLSRSIASYLESRGVEVICAGGDTKSLAADIIICDLGIGNTGLIDDQKSMANSKKAFDNSLSRAQDMANLIREEMAKRSGGRVIYLAPWYWDSYANPIRFEVVREATIGLAKLMSKLLAPSNCNVHCIVPGCIKIPGPAGVNEELVEKHKNKNPPGILHDVGDLVNVISFLASDASKQLTGQVLHLGDAD